MADCIKHGPTIRSYPTLHDRLSLPTRLAPWARAHLQRREKLLYRDQPHLLTSARRSSRLASVRSRMPWADPSSCPRVHSYLNECELTDTQRGGIPQDQGLDPTDDGMQRALSVLQCSHGGLRRVTPDDAIVDAQLDAFIAAGDQTLTISGGEPTLFRKRLLRLVERARAGGIQFVEVQTNAVLIDEALRERDARCRGHQRLRLALVARPRTP